jgi:hypothetical protein
MIGKCELCLEIRELQESHLLARALYKRLRLPANRNPNPVVFSAKGEHQTSHQAVQYLLCSECEQRLHKNGENCTLRYCARDVNVFKLRELLMAHAGDNKLTDDLYRYDCDGILTIDTASLCYFALSVVWRAAVRSWHIDDVTIPPLELGPLYTEAFRLYLMGSSTFPENTALCLLASSLEEVPLICTPPETKKWGDYTSHFFTIPGITFMVDVGKRMPQNIREMCLCRGAGRPLFYTPFADQSNMQDFAELVPSRRVFKSGRPPVINPPNC